MSDRFTQYSAEMVGARHAETVVIERYCGHRGYCSTVFGQLGVKQVVVTPLSHHFLFMYLEVVRLSNTRTSMTIHID